MLVAGLVREMEMEMSLVRWFVRAQGAQHELRKASGIIAVPLACLLRQWTCKSGVQLATASEVGLAITGCARRGAGYL